MTGMTQTTPQLPTPFMSCRPGVTTFKDLLGMTSTLSRNRFLIVMRDQTGQPSSMIEFKGPSVLSVECGNLRGIEALSAMRQQDWSSMDAYDISGATQPLPTPIGLVNSMLLQVAVDTDHAVRDQGPDPDLTDTTGLSEQLSLSPEELQKLQSPSNPGAAGGKCPMGFDAVVPATTTPPAAAPVNQPAPQAVPAQAVPVTPHVPPVKTVPEPVIPVQQQENAQPATPAGDVDRLFVFTVIAASLAIGIVLGLFIGLN